MQILLYIVVAIVLIAVICLLAALILRRVYGRSVRATIAEVYMKIKRSGFNYRRACAEIERLKSEGERPYVLPPHEKLTCKVLEEEICGLQVFEFNPEGRGATVLYFYGGGYIHRPLKYHLEFFDKE